jgi:hypothetical protein
VRSEAMTLQPVCCQIFSLNFHCVGELLRVLELCSPCSELAMQQQSNSNTPFKFICRATLPVAILLSNYILMIPDKNTLKIHLIVALSKHRSEYLKVYFVC